MGDQEHGNELANLQIGEDVVQFVGLEAVHFQVRTNGRGGRRLQEAGRASIANVMDRVNARVDQGRAIVTPMLPRGSRYYAVRGSKEVVIVEEEPRVRTILTDTLEFETDAGRVTKNKFTLAFPYVVYVFYLQDGYMPCYTSRGFFRSAPLKSLKDELWYMSLTHQNVAERDDDYPKGALCMKADTSGMSLSQKIEANMNYYWSSKFGDMGRVDYEGRNGFFRGFSRVAQEDKRFATVRRWEEETQKDPLFVLSAQWSPANTTVEKAISDVLGELREGRHNENTVFQADQIANMIARC